MPHFHQATVSDWQSLQQIALQTFKATYEHLNIPDNFKAYVDTSFSQSQLIHELNNPLSTYFLLQDGVKSIGYIKLNESTAQTELQEADSLELERIYVVQSEHGKGFGKILLQKAIDTSKNRHKKSLWLGVWQENPKAIAFYKHQGFEKFGEHAFILGNDHQIDDLMRISF